MVNFETRTTRVSTALSISSFPLVAYADLLAQAFFFVSLIFLMVFGATFLGVEIPFPALKISALFGALFVFFLQVHAFNTGSIKKTKTALSLKEALANPVHVNMADFLTLETCAIVEAAIQKCKARKLSHVPSEALLYAAPAKNKDVQILLARLGIDVKKLKQDVKNYLEKQDRQKTVKFLLLSESFEKTIMEAAQLAAGRGLSVISEKELLAALAKQDAFFKQVLIEYDLTAKDVENVAFWLDSLELQMERRSKFWTRENLAAAGSIGKDWASGFTVNLDQYCTDWTRVGTGALFNEIIGHAHERQEVETALAKSSFKNALIIGAEGSGRKSIVRAIAKRAYLGISLPELNYKRLVELDLVRLLAKNQDPEKVEFLLDQIFQEVLAAQNVILIIDNLERFVETGAAKPGATDISGILAKYLALPHFQFIGITSFDGLHRNLEKNPSMLEYFTKVEVQEITEFETIRILQNLAVGMEQEHKLLIVYPAVREIVNLAGRYFPAAPFPKKGIDILEETVSYVISLKQHAVLPSHVAKIISDKTQIPVGKMEFKEKSVLLNLENLIHQKIIGQKEAVSEISVAMRRARSGISNKKRPMGVFLFFGPTGVGKTETAKALAEIYFGGQEKMIRLDMSEFQAVTDIPRLLGSMGQVDQQGILTTAVRENPFSLVLLDEIEKAHIDILNLFLQVFDDGYINDGQGRKVIFSNTIIICTSNAGAPDIFKAVEAGTALDKDAILGGLFERGIFKPEFVNRFDASIIFHPLTRENLMDIAQLMLESLAKNLLEKEVTLVITGPLKQKMVDLSYKPQFGAREMRRVMQDKIESPIAQALLEDKIVKGNKIEINPENFEVVVIR